MIVEKRTPLDLEKVFRHGPTAREISHSERMRRRHRGDPESVRRFRTSLEPDPLSPFTRRSRYRPAYPWMKV